MVTLGALGVAATVSWAGATPALATPPTTTYAKPSGTFGDCSTVAQACDISQAVLNAGDGGTVMLADGTYLSTHLAPVGARSLTAEAGATPVLDGGGSGTVLAANSGSMTITGVTFTNTDATDIACQFGALDLEHSDVETTGGVGVSASGSCGSVTVHSSTVTATTTSGFDTYGIVTSNVPVTMTASSLKSNSGTASGDAAYGIFADDAAVSITNSTIDAESTGASSGDVADGVDADAGVALSVTGSTLVAAVHGTGAAGRARGISYDDGSTVTVTSSTATASATGTGDDEYAAAIDGGSASGNLDVSASQFQLSGSHSDGGSAEGIYVDTWDGTVTVDGSSFTETYTAASSSGSGDITGISVFSPYSNSLSVTSSSFTMSSPAGPTGDFGGEIDGVDTFWGSATISDSTFNGTTASLDGRLIGIYSDNFPDLTVDHTTISVTGSSTDTTFSNAQTSLAEGVDAVGSVTLDHDSVAVVAHQASGTNFNFGIGAFAENGSSLNVDSSTVAATADYTGAAGPIHPAEAVGVLSNGTTSVTDSTVTTAGIATGIDSDSEFGGNDTSAVTVEDSTVSGVGGHTVGIATDAAQPIGLYFGNPTGTAASVLVEQSTIAQNGTAGVAKLGVGGGTQTISMGEDIVAGNGADCASPATTVVDLGYNLASDTLCNFSAPSSVNHSTTLAPTLAALNNNGGPTQTMGLLAGSPAINFVAGNKFLNDGVTLACIVPDQRGTNRPGFSSAGAPCDAGAVNATVAPPSGGGGGGGSTPESLALGSSPPSSVVGQSVTFTAILTPAPGCGQVLWSIDGVAQGTGVAVSGGTVSGGGVTVTLGSLSNLAVGGHSVVATFAGCSGFSGASGTTTQVVAKGATSTVVTTSATSLTATVTATAPAVGTPTGTVSFSVDGSPVGSASVGAGGVANLTYTLTTAPAGHVVSATYAGDGNFTGSSGTRSTSGAGVTNPTITAAATSAHPRTAAGWYRSAVTVTFTCTPGSAALTAAGCPAPVTLSTSGAAQSVTGTVAATDGGLATVTVSPINIDTTSPFGLRVHGASDGATYSYAHRHRFLTCTAVDDLSGVATCVVTKHTTTTTHYKVVHFTATATNNAGGTTSRTGAYRYHRHH